MKSLAAGGDLQMNWWRAGLILHGSCGGLSKGPRDDRKLIWTSLKVALGHVCMCLSITSSRGDAGMQSWVTLPKARALNRSQCWDLAADSLGFQPPPSQTYCELVLRFSPAFTAAKHLNLPAMSSFMASASLACFSRAEGSREEAISSHRCGKPAMRADFSRCQ